MAETYAIDVTVSGTGSLASAASAADHLDDGLGDVSDEARAVAQTFGKTAAEAQKMAREFKGADKAAQLLNDHYGDLDSTFAAFGGPLGTTLARVFELREAFGKLSLFTSRGTAIASFAAVGFASLAVALAAVAAAFVAAGVAVVAATIKIADAANKANVLREAMTGSAGAAAGLTATIRRVSTDVPVARSKVAELADTLYKSGKRGRALEEALRAASLEAAGLGKNPGPELIAKRMANLDVIGAKLKDAFADIFAGPSTVDATAKFGKALGGFTERFDQTHSEGRALQRLFSMIVDPLIEGLAALEPVATFVLRGLIIMALDIAIAAVKVRNAVIKMIPDEVKDKISEWASSQGVLNAALEVGKYMLGVVVVAIGILVGALVIAGGVFVATIAFVYALNTAIANAVVWIGSTIKSVATALASFATMGAAAAGAMVDGLVSGIRAGVGPVVDAIRSMASSAVGAIEAALQIASPSKVFAWLGKFTGLGFAEGVDESTTTVRTSLETLVAPPEAPMVPMPQRAGQARGGAAGPMVDLSGASFVFHGVPDAVAGGRKMVEEALLAVLEGDAIAAGAA